MALLCLHDCEGQMCFNARFPQMFGGTLSNTEVTDLDVDTLGNMVIGGTTTDTSFATLDTGQPAPIVAYQDLKGVYKWGISLHGTHATNYIKVLEVKFTITFNEAYVVIDQVTT